MDERPATVAAPAKVLAPDVSALEPRTALLAHLAPARERAVTWIDGPPGTGKTSLAAQGRAEFAGHGIWLRIDPGDADAADFFHFLHCAAVSAGLDADRLPRFSAEYGGEPAAFARRFLHACSRLGDWLLVLDNLDAVDPATPPHDLVAAARAMRTPDSLLVVTSRAEPEPDLARLRVEGVLKRLSADDLRVAPEEAVRIARRAGVDWAPAAIEQARERSRGWVAGFRLMLSLADGDAPPATPDSSTPRVLLDYLEREFLGHLPQATVELLGRLAPLESVPGACVRALAGDDGLERLDALARRHAFVAREARGGDALYRLDPLLCECLETWRMRTSTAAERAESDRRTGGALAATGDLERAVDLWLVAGEHERAADALRSLAPRQLAAGRVTAARQRLSALPEDRRARDPWLRLWHATAHIPVAPAEARAGLLKAYGEFRAADTREGAALAWAGTAESLWVEWGDYDSVAWLLDELDWLGEGDLSPTARARLAPQAVLLLGILRPQARRSLEAWVEAARRTPACAEVGPVEQLTILHTLLAIDVWLRGAREHGDNLLVQGRRLEATTVLPPLQQLMWRGAVASHRLWFADDPREAIAEAETGLALAREAGVHQWDYQLNALAACGAIAAGETERAAAWLAAIESSGQADRPVDASFHAWIEGWAAIRRGDTISALARARKAGEDLAGGGPWNAVHIVHLALAQAERLAGDPLAAERHAQRVGTAAREVGAGIHRWLAALSRAHLRLDAGETGRARRLLRAALAFGEHQGYLRLAWWPPAAIATLCNEALRAGTPPAYVRRLALSNGLHEWHPGRAIGEWPWPVRLHALGDLRVVVDGETLELGGKGAALLQLLATDSTTSIDQARITDLLWPDVEGDRARRSLDTTLHRVRRRLGHPDAIRMHAGRIELEPSVVWTDLRALTEHLEAATAANDTAWQDLLALLAEVRGPAADWPGAAGQRARQRLARAAEQRLDALVDAGEIHGAIDTAEAVLGVDGTAERLCRLALQAARRAGDPARAHQLYETCRAALEHHHGTGPAERTGALYREATAGSGGARPSRHRRA
jgi:ATP/maltotriose-dependent transcriptional regulator MalT/DNA-binding SARP family transcriptional activator